MTLLRYIPLAAALACGAASAGTATVNFIEPTRYTDLGATVGEQQENMHALARHFDALAQRNLPAGHHLSVEVLNVDLAGRPRMSRYFGTWVRVVRNGPDWPHMELRYTLSVNGQPVQTMQEHVKDQLLSGIHSSMPLHFEKRMLSRWFRSRFGPEA